MVEVGTKQPNNLGGLGVGEPGGLGGGGGGGGWEYARNTLQGESAKNYIINPQKGTTPTERSILSFSIQAMSEM